MIFVVVVSISVELTPPLNSLRSSHSPKLKVNRLNGKIPFKLSTISKAEDYQFFFFNYFLVNFEFLVT